MTHIITVLNYKGGVGKTTLTVNLAAGLVLHGAVTGTPKRVLLIDLGPQNNSILTLVGSYFGGEFKSPGVTLADYLRGETGEMLTKAIVRSRLPIKSESKLDYIYSEGKKITALGQNLAGSPNPRNQFLLADLLEEITDKYDYVIIDTGPQQDLLVANALNASTHALIPVAAEGFSIMGLEDTLEFIDQIVRYSNDKLKILGVVPNRITATGAVKQQILEYVKNTYPEHILPPVHQRESVAAAIDRGMDIFSHSPSRQPTETMSSSDPGTIDMSNLISIILDRLGEE